MIVPVRRSARGFEPKNPNVWITFLVVFGLEKKVFVCYSLRTARLAQLVEHSTDTRKVLGSNPSARTKFVLHFDCTSRSIIDTICS